MTKPRRATDEQQAEAERILAAMKAEGVDAEEARRPGIRGAAGFECPRCGMVSYNPNDLREGYCGACHDWTGNPPS